MLVPVKTKARKYSPSVETVFSVNIERNKSIEIYHEGKKTQTFKIGDTAEYDSYNLVYLGTITKITDKTVQVTEYPGSRNEKRHNLNLYEFCYKNYDFDLDRINKQNMETSYYI